MRKISLYLFWGVAFLVYQITQLVVLLDRKNVFKLKFPKTVSELKTQKEWCIAQLIEAKIIPENADILNFEVKQLNAEAIYRSEAALVEIDFQTDKGIENFKCIAKFSPSAGSVKNRAVFNLQQNHVKEINFYKYLAKRLDGKANVPQMYLGVFDTLTANSCLLIEYLPSAPQYKDLEASPDEKLNEIVQEMAKFQAEFWNLGNDEVKGIQTIPRIITDFFASSSNQWWTKDMNTVFHKNWAYMNVNQSLIHGDARIGNMIIDENEEFFLIDWQAARVSIAAYDLAYFLILSLNVEQRKAQEENLKKHYYESLIANIKDKYTWNEFESDYNEACIMVMTMLAIPWLSGEGSFDSNSLTLVNFIIGHYFWHKRLKSKMDSFDWEWMARNYELDEKSCKDVVEKFTQPYYNEFEKLYKSSNEITGLFDLKLAEIEKAN